MQLFTGSALRANEMRVHSSTFKSEVRMTAMSQTVIADCRQLWIYYWPLHETDPDFSNKDLKASCLCGLV